MSEYTYATLQETNIEEHESWLTFIRCQGNEDNLKHFRDQLDQVDWHCEDEDNMESAFDLDTDYLICEKTAKEMTKLDLNSHMSHRKFDGKLQTIDLGLRNVNEEVTKKRKEKRNDNNIQRINKDLSYGQIEKYIDEEDENSDAEYNDETDTEQADDSDDSDDSDVSDVSKEIKSLPPLIDTPRFVKKAQRHTKKK